MSGLGNDLVVNLAGNNAKLKSSIADSKGGLKGFASSAKSLLTPITAGLAAVAAGAIAAGVAVYGLTSNLAALDKVAKKSTQTGLGGKFIQQLSFAADQSGVNFEDVTKMIGKMTINIGKAEGGLKASQEAFTDIGISMSELSSMKPQEQFMRISDAISKLPTHAQRASAAVAVFGKTGLEMIPLFAGGVDGISQLLAKAERLAIGVDAAGLKAVENAMDALGSMKAAFGALLDQVTVGLAPAFTYVGTTIADMIPPVTKLFEKFNNLEGKMRFIGDILTASVDVGIESIRLNWSNLLDDMIDKAAGFGKKIGPMLLEAANPLAGFNGNKISDLKANDQGEGLAAAKQRLDSVIQRLQDVVPFAEQGPQRPAAKPADDGTKLAGLFGEASGFGASIFDQVKNKVGESLGKSKADINFWEDLGKTALGIGGAKAEEDPLKKPDFEMKFSGAMQKGSAEAYSTILQSMGRNDPNVKATEKQTKELVKAIKAQPPSIFNMLESIVT